MTTLSKIAQRTNALRKKAVRGINVLRQRRTRTKIRQRANELKKINDQKASAILMRKRLQKEYYEITHTRGQLTPSQEKRIQQIRNLLTSRESPFNLPKIISLGMKASEEHSRRYKLRKKMRKLSGGKSTNAGPLNLPPTKYR
jgi:hypothetical protein